MPSLAHAAIGPEPGVIEIAAPEIQTRTRLDFGNAGDWLCFWCLNRVASESDRLSRDGQSEFSFTNPQNIRFHIITFTQTIGCRQAGVPTLEHTWFPGHAWSYCLCERCRTHLGWFYSGPTTFAALIRDRIVRASLVMN
jgi:hypothetical protein